MEHIPKNEQWRLEGDCSKCRRNNYCQKPCTRKDRYNKIKMEEFVREAVDQATGGIYTKLQEITAKNIERANMRATLQRESRNTVNDTKKNTHDRRSGRS